jgi:hypothetical protein
MKWALVANSNFKYNKWTFVNGENKFLECDATPGTIVNLIVYDGIAQYTPPANCDLVEVADDKQIGDVI